MAVDGNSREQRICRFAGPRGAENLRAHGLRPEAFERFRGARKFRFGAFARFENYGYVDFGDAAVEQYFPHVFSFPPICGKWREFRHFKRAPFVYIKTGRKKSVNLLYSNCSFLYQTTPFLLFGRRKNMKRGPRRGPLLQEYFLLSPPAPCG